MPRILGVDLPNDKPTHISLRYIYGIGPTSSLELCQKAGVDPQRRASDLSDEDLIADEDMVVTVSHTGYVKRNPVSLYRAQKRGGKGKTGAMTAEDDFIEQIFVASTHAYLLLFTNKGRVFWLKVHELPQAGRAARGKAIVNLVQLGLDAPHHDGERLRQAHDHRRVPAHAPRRQGDHRHQDE